MVTPAEYGQKYSNQPIFRLKNGFSSRQAEEPPAFLQKIDFKKEPMKYLEAARDYSFDGNLPDWDPFKNTKAGWYHIPWLHPTATGPPPIRPTAAPRASTG